MNSQLFKLNSHKLLTVQPLTSNIKGIFQMAQRSVHKDTQSDNVNKLLYREDKVEYVNTMNNSLRYMVSTDEKTQIEQMAINRYKDFDRWNEEKNQWKVAQEHYGLSKDKNKSFVSQRGDDNEILNPQYGGMGGAQYFQIRGIGVTGTQGASMASWRQLDSRDDKKE
ncbi:UNKNOWN [Stylonychia lemnae]|uniref:Uncharacterized protein n=1 Tax=Stylonychia lemnae TaxID=5949 RepID=A0A077ZW33_STYLE|nr:UNKNOWN [Stylonychia lemnae]|eukprot:CDW73475.1 UNKNOWN [Stylonychia lemnae]